MFRIIKFNSGNYGVFNSRDNTVLLNSGGHVTEECYFEINNAGQFTLAEAVAKTEELNKQIELSKWTVVPNASELLRQEQEAAKEEKVDE